INPDIVDKNDPKYVQLQDEDIMTILLQVLSLLIMIGNMKNWRKMYMKPLAQRGNAIVVPHEDAQATLGDTNNPFTSISISKDYADKYIAANDAY
ncbi:hypothetical protein Tco_1398590, partial [Tanacetum coccineum]